MTARLLVACLLAVAAAAPVHLAHAEKGDRDKPVNIESDRMTADEQKQVAVFEGRVVLTQGTFVLRADKLTVRQDGAGFQSGVAVGNPATFRQKRDGVDEWIDGEALRIEYDGKAERVELFDKARINRDKDEVRGNFISYDTKSEVFRVQGAKEAAAAQSREGRVRMVIQPKKKEEGAPPPAAPLDLKPATGVGKS